MTAPCPAISESLAALDAVWAEPPCGGPLVPVGLPSQAFGIALGASAVLQSHGWRHSPTVKIRHLRTMLVHERRHPGGH